MAADPNERHWLLEPPAPGGAKVHIHIGRDAKLSPKARDALETFAREMHSFAEDEFAGKPCPSRISCDPRGNCQPETGQQCYWYTTCHIKPP